MRKLIILCFPVVLFFYLPKGYGQNLIADPGFEIWDGTTGGNPSTLSGLTYWYTANGTADHHHIDIAGGSNLTGLDTTCTVGQGYTWCGYPYEGGGVLGCWKGNGPDGSKEWGGTQLLEPLEPGACYEISFWIQNKKDNPTALYETNQWGVFFSDTQYPVFNANLWDFNTLADQWVSCPQVIGGSEWQQVQFQYTAPEAFEYLYIGYVGNVSESTFTAANDDYLLGFYVWIDEVVVRKVDVESSADVSICKGDSTLLEFTSDYALSWTDGVQWDTSRTVWVKPDQTTTYYVTATGNQGCTALDSVTVTVYQETVLTYPDPLCTVSEPQLLNTGAGAGVWSGPGITDATSGQFDPSVSGSGNFEIYFESDNSCEENLIMLVEVQEVPEINMEAASYLGCEPFPVAFSLVDAGSATAYTWDFGDGNTSNEASPTHTYELAGNYAVSLEVTHFENCMSEYDLPAEITIYPQPTAAFSFLPSTINLINSTAQFESHTEGITNQWQWDFGDGFQGAGPAPVHDYQAHGQYEVSLAVYGPANCADSISQILTVENAVRIYLPNAFSPNDDGRNDRLAPGYIGELYDYSFAIYNRWGSPIFESSNPAESWDGTLPNGDAAAAGIYAYVLSYTLLPATATGESVSEVLSGDVMLVR